MVLSGPTQSPEDFPTFSSQVCTGNLLLPRHRGRNQPGPKRITYGQAYSAVRNQIYFLSIQFQCSETICRKETGFPEPCQDNSLNAFYLGRCDKGPRDYPWTTQTTKPALGAWVPCNTHSGKDLLLSVLGAGKGVTANHACLRCVSMPTLLPDFIQERPAPVSLHKAEVLWSQCLKKKVRSSQLKVRDLAKAPMLQNVCLTMQRCVHLFSYVKMCDCFMLPA